MGHEILLTIFTTTHIADLLVVIKLGAERLCFEIAFVKCDFFFLVHFLALPSTEEQASTV